MNSSPSISSVVSGSPHFGQKRRSPPELQVCVSVYVLADIS